MTTAADACAECTGLCQTCPVDSAGEWPTRDQDDIATAEAGDLAFAGADAPRPESGVADVWARHYRWRTRLRNRHLFGAGGLFDNLEIPA